MIAEAVFGPDGGGIRRLRFVRRSSIPTPAACLVANGLREALREMLDARCELVIGEPAAVAADAWAALTRDAQLFITRGRQTDVVLVFPRDAARRLVLRAFGETGACAPDVWSSLELRALERIASRCSAAFDPLFAERMSPVCAIDVREAPHCVGYFDVRVSAPIPLDFGIGIVRELPAADFAKPMPPEQLAHVGVRIEAVVSEGMMPAAAFAAMRAGDVLPLGRVDAPATLRAAGRPIASGVCGTLGERAAFRVTAGAAVR